MGTCSGNIIKQQLKKQNKTIVSRQVDKYIFTGCRNTECQSISIQPKLGNPGWQIGFFDADDGVYSDKIEIVSPACFSSIVRNYWWNGKEGDERKEGYYSLVKSVKELEIEEKHVNDLLDYLKSRYQAGEHWRLYELDRSIELRIKDGVEQTIVEQLFQYFDNIWCNEITDNLKTENNITCNCDWYQFTNCKGVVPERLIINATVKYIHFIDAVNEVHIPEITMEEKGNLRSIIQNDYGHGKYSLLHHLQTLVIRNNPKVLYDLVNYINGKYKIDDGWVFHQLNKKMKVMIEKPGIAFDAVKEIANCFVDILVDNYKSEEYFARQQPYQKQFQEHFDKYDLETDLIGNFVPASQELRLKGRKFNIRNSNIQINKLQIDQKIIPQQFICFHDTGKPVVVNNIFIKNNGDLRCVLQNAYYNGTDSGFFSLLQTAKQLDIRSNQNQENQVLVDLADYIEGKYALNANWKQEELDKDMRIFIDSGGYSLSLSIVQRLRNYFRNISIDRIWTTLETENVVDQECRCTYIFVNSKEINPQKLTINAKLIGSETLITFNQSDNEMHIPEITIDEQGCFATIIRNYWYNNKEDDEEKYGYYSLVQYVETLTIRNNLGALKDFADYMGGKYEIGNSDWELQQLSKNIKVVIEGLSDAFLHVLRIFKYFKSVIINGKQANDYIQTIEQEELKNQNYRAFRTCFEVHDLCVYPPQYGVEFQKELELVDYVYNIRKSVDNINSLIVRQKLDLNQFICFHDIDKPVTVDKILIDDVGDLRSVLQNAYYSNDQTGFFNLLGTAKKLQIRNNEQAVEELADYVDDKYSLHYKWKKQTLDKNIEIKINVMNSPDVARRLRNYFRNVIINRICMPLKTENIVDQECKYQYIFTNCRDINLQRLVFNVKLIGSLSLILFNDADGEVYIPEITIGERGDFDAIVRNQWWNCKNDGEIQIGFYSLISHVETLIIQNNPEAVCDLDKYVSENHVVQDSEHDKQEAKKLSRNITVRINGVNGLDEQINRLKEYFSYIFVDDRKALGNQRREAIANIKLDSDKIQHQGITNTDKRSAIAQADAEIAETRQRIERARARLGRRRARFQEYLALAE